MSLLFRSERIIDRVNEAKKIEEIIKENARNLTSHVIILWAETRYGKSAIMQKVKDSFAHQAIRIVIVDTPPVNNTTLIDGQYLNYIASAIDDSVHNQFSLETFLPSHQSQIQPLIDADPALKMDFR